ncbi:WAT1-related protein [Forsythia ovata]|uniref:WAT1-related protein n=1 Tax=Forsythia ovata TaxID=205694 RepID=A0ABD1PV43_9LAMI
MGDQTSWEKMSIAFNKMKPYLAMISLQFGYAGLFIITMVCLKRGFSHWVLVVYRHAVATLVFAPFAIFFERKIRPKMTLSVFLKIMLLAFLEPVLDQNLYYVGLKSTSATFASAIVNVLPAITFIMAIIFRLEKVNPKQIRTQSSKDHWNSGSHHRAAGGSAEHEHWVSGTIMLISCIVGWSAFFIVQNKTLKEYPAELSLTSLVCFMGTVEGGVVALVMERHTSAWAIGFDSRLLAAAYSSSEHDNHSSSRSHYFGLNKFILGSLIGAIIIVFGLYSVVWGKSKDKTTSNKSTYDEGKAQDLPVVDIKTSANVDNDNIETAGKSHIPQDQFFTARAMKT